MDLPSCASAQRALEKDSALQSFKIIDSHRNWYESKVCIRFYISFFYYNYVPVFIVSEIYRLLVDSIRFFATYTTTISFEALAGDVSL